MSDALRQKLEECLTLLKQGQLTPAHLQGVIDALGSAGSLSSPTKPATQDLLYLQVRGTSPDAQAIGMMMVRNGQIDQGPAAPEQWPYQNVLAAIQDGWRVVSFPNLALAADDTRTIGLGCEFILERSSR